MIRIPVDLTSWWFLRCDWTLRGYIASQNLKLLFVICYVKKCAQFTAKAKQQTIITEEKTCHPMDDVEVAGYSPLRHKAFCMDLFSNKYCNWLLM